VDGVVGRPDGLDGLEAVEELGGEGGEVARAGGALALVERVHHRRHLAGERAVVRARPHLGRRAQVVTCACTRTTGVQCVKFQFAVISGHLACENFLVSHRICRKYVGRSF
jgi:hypothetical protein